MTVGTAAYTLPKSATTEPDARRVMAQFLSEHPQIDAVLSANDGMALGALEALKAANRTAIVIGINGILPAVKEIESGTDAVWLNEFAPQISSMEQCWKIASF